MPYEALWQHPQEVDADGEIVYQAHCVGCGKYVEDWDEVPPADFLCDDCEADDRDVNRGWAV